MNVRFLNQNIQTQEYLLILLAISWGLFALVYMPKSGLFFISILISLHLLSYTFWVNGYSIILFGITLIFLTFLKFYIFGFNNYSLVFSVILAILSFFVVRYFSSFIEEMLRNSEKIKDFWEKNLRFLCCYKETNNLLIVVTPFAFYLFGDIILIDPTLYELWVALVFYTGINFLIIQALNLLAAIKIDSMSNQAFYLFCISTSLVLILLLLIIWFHISCTTLGFSPPNLPGVGAYQEMVQGFRSPTTEQQLVGNLYAFMHPGEIPPLKEGTFEVDFRKTLPLIVPSTDSELLYRNYVIKSITETFPFTKKVIGELLNGIGPFDLTKI